MHGQGRRAYVPFVDKVLLMGKAVSTKFASCVLMVALGWVDKEQDGNLFEACRTIFNILLPSLNLYPCVRCCRISIHFPQFWRDVFGMWGTASTPPSLHLEGLAQVPGTQRGSWTLGQSVGLFGVWSTWSTGFVPIEWRWKKYCVLFTEYVNLCMSHTMYSYLLHVFEFEHLAF